MVTWYKEQGWSTRKERRQGYDVHDERGETKKKRMFDRKWFVDHERLAFDQEKRKNKVLHFKDYHIYTHTQKKKHLILRTNYFKPEITKIS